VPLQCRPLAGLCGLEQHRLRREIGANVWLWYADATVVFALLPLFYISLLLEIGSSAARPSAIPMDVYSQEMDLQSLPIDRKVLRELPVWDQDAAGGLRKPRHSEVFDNSNTTPILILHLFATWCSPCKAELPLWRKLKSPLWNKSSGRVRVFHILMQKNTDDLQAFVREVGEDKMPLGPLYVDRSGSLSENLSRAFDDKSLPPLPIALFLDPERIVRRTIVGSIAERTSEVFATSIRMLRLVQQEIRSGRRPKPHEEDDDVFTQ
jgi:thiol-disulfide isomerase/thioredoxin